jgi:hypothetical protein
LKDGCAVAKFEEPKTQEVVDCLQLRAYILDNGKLFIAKGETMFE